MDQNDTINFKNSGTISNCRVADPGGFQPLMFRPDPDPIKFLKPDPTSFQNPDPDPTKTPGSISENMFAGEGRLHL